MIHQKPIKPIPWPQGIHLTYLMTLSDPMKAPLTPQPPWTPKNAPRPHWTLKNTCSALLFIRGPPFDDHDLLAPSGALIAIPTYYWSAPHFFRSHRSSTLDFHFLSHYSYIKAIMLYKGNHWTKCAGFMDASWVRLGI